MSIDQVLFSKAYAAAAQPAQPSLLENMLPMIMIFFVMYLIIIRPQTKKAKEHSDLLSTLKNGDEVVTSGGIIGRVKGIADDFITLEVGNNSQLKVLKEHVSFKTKANANIKK